MDIKLYRIGKSLLMAMIVCMNVLTVSVLLNNCSQPTEKNIVTGNVSEDTVSTNIAAPDTTVIK